MNILRDVLTEIVSEFTDNGYEDQQALNEAAARLREAAEASIPPAQILADKMKRAMKATYKRATSPGAVKKRHPDISRFTVGHLRPYLLPELDRRIMAAADLIVLNREKAVEATLQRFTGWATSIPKGGSRVVDKVEVKQGIIKPVAQLRYEERRMTIDQGHKLVASINAIIADDNDAIAAIWRDHGSVDTGYDARHSHMQRNGKVYAIRNNWAMREGLMKKGAGYTDEMTQPGEEVYCRCYYVYLQNLRDLPDDMLTAKGRDMLAKVRVAA